MINRRETKENIYIHAIERKKLIWSDAHVEVKSDLKQKERTTIKSGKEQKQKNWLNVSVF